MKIGWLNRIRKTPMPTRCKALLNEMAMSSNDQGVCFSKQAVLMARTGLPSGTFFYSLGELQLNGWVETVRTHRPDGVFSTNEYHIQSPPEAREWKRYPKKKKAKPPEEFSRPGSIQLDAPPSSPEAPPPAVPEAPLPPADVIQPSSTVEDGDHPQPSSTVEDQSTRLMYKRSTETDTEEEKTYDDVVPALGADNGVVIPPSAAPEEKRNEPAPKKHGKFEEGMLEIMRMSKLLTPPPPPRPEIEANPYYDGSMISTIFFDLNAGAMPWISTIPQLEEAVSAIKRHPLYDHAKYGCSTEDEFLNAEQGIWDALEAVQAGYDAGHLSWEKGIVGMLVCKLDDEYRCVTGKRCGKTRDELFNKQWMAKGNHSLFPLQPEDLVEAGVEE